MLSPATAQSSVRFGLTDLFGLLSRPTLFPRHYIWFLVLSAMDLLLTSVILHLGGREVNIIANQVLYNWDLAGLTVYKFLIVALVVVLCEAIGRLEPLTGRRVAACAILITLFPVTFASAQLASYYYIVA